MQYNKERILSRLMEMIQIDSVSYKEGPMTDYLQKYFEDRGYEVYRDQAGKAVGGDHSGNLLIHIPGTMEGESICLNAHQDTVEPGIGIVPVLEDGKLKSSGDTILAADDKSGIAIMLELLEVLKETGTPHRDMYYLFTICEESGMYGAKNFDYSKIPTKNIFSLDGAGNLGFILKSGAGKDVLTITFHGKSAHGGIEPEKGINAINAAALAISKVKFGRIDPETTSNIGRIEGGAATNIVTDKVTFTCEVRSHSQAQIEAQVQKIMDACQEAPWTSMWTTSARPTSRIWTASLQRQRSAPWSWKGSHRNTISATAPATAISFLATALTAPGSPPVCSTSIPPANTWIWPYSSRPST